MKKSIVAVFAHPDDEVLAAGALLRAREAGYVTHAISATRGEACRVKHPEFMTEDNRAEVRTEEFANSCRAMGLDSWTFLDLPDRGGPGWESSDGLGRFVEAFEECDPEIVVTFPTDGGDGHPDHIETSRLATRAFEKLSDGDRRLYYLSGPPRAEFRRIMRFVPAPMRTKEKVYSELAPLGEGPVVGIRLSRSERRTKWQCVEAHRSQFPDGRGWYYSFPPFLFRQFAKAEYYLRVRPEGARRDEQTPNVAYPISAFRMVRRLGEEPSS